MVERHFAWFRRDTGVWLREWRGLVPSPELPPALAGDARLVAMNEWQQHTVEQLAALPVLEEAIDRPAWDHCPAAGAVCLDVTRFGWPVGDHRWHIWNDADRLLDWPASSVHTFIQVRMDSLDVVANTRSHRPVRCALPGQRVFDITGSPMAAHFGHIWGRFVWLENRWGFQPTTEPSIVPVRVQRALAEAPIDFDFIGGQHVDEGRARAHRREPVREQPRRDGQRHP